MRSLAGKRVLVLGGWGLVGAAICRELLADVPDELLVHSLRASEAEEAARELAASVRGPTRVAPTHGNVFLPEDLASRPPRELAADPAARRRLLDEIYGDLTPEVLAASALHRLIGRHRPHVLVDCINTATVLAYEDVYESVRRVRRLLEPSGAPPDPARLAQAVEEQLGVLQLPRLIRHVQILFEAMRRYGTELYLKIGTTGTGGMGLNVPYTHSEERPSRLLLSKSGLAGAHSMLLFLMGSTPAGPAVKEIKPAAAVAWKRIASGPVLRGGRPIPLYDCDPGAALTPAQALAGSPAPWRPLGGVLEAAFVDTGENGMFSREEFETVTALGQMEFVTPEEVARHARLEILGAATGRDVVGALAGANLRPTYRAGALRREALDELSRLEAGGAPSVAFEMLGPPRLSKLLHEAHLLGLVRRPFPSLAGADPERVSAALLDLVRGRPDLRAAILSIGIPILLPSGALLRGPSLKTPPPGDLADGRSEPGPEDLERWARAGWVDLRPLNVSLWRDRTRTILDRARREPGPEAGTAGHLTLAYWEGGKPWSPGKLAAWILANEDRGERYL